MTVAVSPITGVTKLMIGNNIQETFKNINYLIDTRGKSDKMKIGNIIFPIRKKGGVHRMAKKHKEKSTIDYKSLATSAIVDLLVGIILLILDKIF